MDQLSVEYIWETEGGETYFCANNAIIRLLQDNMLFCNFRAYSRNPRFDKETIVLFAIVNDVFAWGGADAEAVESDADLEELTRLHLDDPTFGVIKWVCRKRKMQPQAPLVELIKTNGGWTEEWESLPPNLYDRREDASGGEK